MNSDLINRLLHDAEHADSGAMMATVMKDDRAALELLSKRNRLIAEALALDPECLDDAWKQTSLNV